jgi:hypothetical protein
MYIHTYTHTSITAEWAGSARGEVIRTEAGRRVFARSDGDADGADVQAAKLAKQRQTRVPGLATLT